METGTIKVFFPGKGFGFIKRTGATAGGRDVFVHVRQIEGEVPLEPGDEVVFEEGLDERSARPCALNVRPAEAM